MPWLRRSAALGWTLAALALLPRTALGTTMDFEGLGLPEGTTLTTLLAYPGVTFSGAGLILPGNPNVGFNGNSTGGGLGGIDHANSGATISRLGGSFGTTTITFAAPITMLSLDLADVEQATVTESVEIRVYDAPTGGLLLYSVTVTGGDPGTGDGALTPVPLTGFPGDLNIRRVEVQRLTGPVGANPGFAIDNVRYTETSIPVRPITWGRLRAEPH